MKIRVVGLIFTILVLAVTSIGVFAEAGSVTITGGSLSVIAQNVTLSSVIMDGTDKTATSDFGSNTWTATDARGSGAGWNLTITATDFVNAELKTIDIGAAGSEFQIQLTDDHIAVDSGNTKPTTNVSNLTDIPKLTPLNFMKADLTEGMGSYTLQPNFLLKIPASTYTGSYSSTITIAAVTGPD
jgi:hypothetical protein